ncbi:MAG: histidine kinase dimerization/phospho-acceptor domain-containing protein, partial [candidate division WOR-3 bacterium]
MCHHERLGSALDWLAGQECDCILLDLSLPDSSGIETVRKTRAAAPAKPVVVMTGLDDEQMATTVLSHGAQDYLVKGRFDSQLLVRTMRYAVERQRYELQLERNCRELERLNELKNRFLGMAAHDLRNPLAVILTASDFLLSDAAERLSPEKKKEFLKRISANSEFMVRLIDDLLDFAHIESGEFELRLQSVDLGALLSANVGQNRLIAATKGIDVRLNPNGGIPEVRVDPARIERVLNNLIGNAVKFSKPGSVVSVSARTDNGSVVIAVADNGPGIPSDLAERIFE